jgi:hypothetical protein
MQWFPAGMSAGPQKTIRKLIECQQVLATVFWDNKGVLLVVLLQK